MCVSWIFYSLSRGTHGEQRDKEGVDAGILQATFAGLGERCTRKVSNDLVRKGRG